jgi:excisionase family DNA binding protein
MTPTEQIAAGLAWLSLRAARAGAFASTVAVPQARRPVDASKQLLTQIEAARALGVDRRTTLAELIADGQISTVPGRRGPRIPRSEVDRLVDSGIPPRGSTARSCRVHRPASPSVPRDEVAARIRALPVQ